MGNPLSNLTGAGYGSYYNSLAGDYASLLTPGSTNAMMENLAAGSSRLYTLGQMDEGRMLASSMLGAFSNVYSASPDSEENVTNLINKISGQMKGASAGRKRDLMTWAGMIDPSLPKILQSMDTLGISDYRTFMNPETQGVRWTANRGNAYMENWRKAFQMDQYQFQSIGTNITFNKDRIVHKIWTSFGFKLYNALNIILEKIADNIDPICKSISDIIDNIKGSETFSRFKDGFKDFIESLKKGDLKGIFNSISQTFKRIGQQIIEGLMEGIRPFVDYLGDIKYDWRTKTFSMIDYSKKTMNEASPEAQNALASVRNLLVDSTSSYGPGVTVEKLRGKLQSLTLSKDWDTVSAALGITPEDLESDKALAKKLGIQNDLIKRYDEIRSAGVVQKTFGTVHDVGTKFIESAVEGAGRAIQNVINNEMGIKLYLDGKELAKVFIDATGKATTVGKHYLEAQTDKWSR